MGGPRPGEDRRRRELPATRQLGSKPLGRVAATRQLPCRIGRDMGDDVCCRRGDMGDDELSSEGREQAEAVLLPGPDEWPRRTCVGDRADGGRKRQAAAGTFAAALHGPRGRRTASAAVR